MTTSVRKAAKAAFKDQKSVAAVYAVRCIPSGQVWVGTTPNLGAIQNRIWFSLRHGDISFHPLQTAWKAHGEESFAFEELERLDEDVSPIRRKDLLKQRAAYWQRALKAQSI